MQSANLMILPLLPGLCPPLPKLGADRWASHTVHPISSHTSTSFSTSLNPLPSSASPPVHLPHICLFSSFPLPRAANPPTPTRTAATACLCLYRILANPFASLP